MLIYIVIYLISKIMDDILKKTKYNINTQIYLLQLKECKKEFNEYLDWIQRKLKDVEYISWREFKMKYGVDSWKYLENDRQKYNGGLLVEKIAMKTLTCMKCKKNEFINTSVQSRRADEGANSIFMCVNCQNVMTFKS
jgi:DNA-directed RNA polymerase subunit M/transcription elongation factor TFIIS